MQLSLERAVDLKESVEQAIPDVKGQSDISIYESDVEAKTAIARVDALSEIALADRLASIACQLGKDIVHHEAISGLGALLEDRERLNTQKYRLENLVANKPFHPNHTHGQVDARQKANVAGVNTYLRGCYSEYFEVTVDIFNANDLAGFRWQLADVKHQLHGIDAMVNELNNKTLLTLNDPDATLLREQGLL